MNLCLYAERKRSVRGSSWGKGKSEDYSRGSKSRAGTISPTRVQLYSPFFVCFFFESIIGTTNTKKKPHLNQLKELE